MIAACPECETRYRLPARSKVGRNASFRCARCEHVFTADDALLEGPVQLDESAIADPPAEDVDEVEVVDDDAGRPAKRPKRRASRRETDTEKSGPSPAQFGVRALLGITLGYAVFSIYLYTHPTRIAALFGRVPILGAAFNDPQLGPDQIQLAEVKGEYRQVQGSAVVFVVSGIAINNAPVPVRSVQIKARVAGAREDAVVVYCGTQVHDIERFSVPELQMLQSMERPPSTWTLGPGQQTPFTLVFANPPPALREFTAEVATVQRIRPEETQGA